MLSSKKSKKLNTSQKNDKTPLFLVLIVLVVGIVAIIVNFSNQQITPVEIQNNDLSIDNNNNNIVGQAFKTKNIEKQSDIEISKLDLEDMNSFEEELNLYEDIKLLEQEPKQIDIDLERTEIPKNLQNTRNNPQEDPANKYEYDTDQDFFDSLLITPDGFAYLSRPYGTFTLTEDIDFPYTLVLEGTEGDLIFDCNNHEIDGINFENQNPVLLAQQNVIIKNCKVKNRLLGYELNTDSRIETSTFDQVKYGIALNDNSEADECYVDGQTFMDTEKWVGFVLRNSSLISDSEIYNINIYENNNNYVEEFIGFYVDKDSENNILSGNSLHNMNLDFENLENWIGFYFDYPESYFPEMYSVELTESSIFNINTNFLISNTTWYGIYTFGSDNILVEECEIYDNTVDFNHFNFNQWYGIYYSTQIFWGQHNFFNYNEIYNNEVFIDTPLEFMEDIAHNQFIGLYVSVAEIMNNEIHDNIIPQIFNQGFQISPGVLVYNCHNDAIGIIANYNCLVNNNNILNNLNHFLGIYIINSEGHNNNANYNGMGIKLEQESDLYDSTANYNTLFYGIYSYSSNIYDSIANYNVQDGLQAYYSHISNSEFNHNSGTGIYMSNSLGNNIEANYNHLGIHVGRSDEITDYDLIDSHAQHNSGDGIRAWSFAKLYNIESNLNNRGFRLENSASVYNSIAQDNSEYGFYLEEWEEDELPPLSVHNSISEYNGEHGFYAEFGGLIDNSISRHNEESGFYLEGLSSVINSKSYLNEGTGYSLEENANVINSSASMNQEEGFVLSDFSYASNSLAKGNVGGGFVLNNNASSFGIEASQNQGNGIRFNDNATGFISEAYNNNIGSHIEPNATITHSKFCDNGLDFNSNWGTANIELVATTTQGRWQGVTNLPCDCNLNCTTSITTLEDCYGSNGTPYYFFNFYNIEDKKNVCCIPEGFILEVIDPETCEVDIVHIN